MDYHFQVRVTGVLVEDGEILLVRQRLSERRSWSLPGGRLERGETLAQGLCREMEEETGLKVEVKRLLYLCDAAQSGHTLLHATFLAQRTGAPCACRTTPRTKIPSPMCVLCRWRN